VRAPGPPLPGRGALRASRSPVRSQRVRSTRSGRGSIWISAPGFSPSAGSARSKSTVTEFGRHPAAASMRSRVLRRRCWKATMVAREPAPLAEIFVQASAISARGKGKRRSAWSSTNPLSSSSGARGNSTLPLSVHTRESVTAQVRVLTPSFWSFSRRRRPAASGSEDQSSGKSTANALTGSGPLPARRTQARAARRSSRAIPRIALRRRLIGQSKSFMARRQRRLSPLFGPRLPAPTPSPGR